MELLISIDRIVRTAKAICSDGDLGITYNELLFLITLERKCNSIRDICKFLLIDKGYAYRTLIKMMEKELVIKKGDRKTAEYFLANYGIEVLREAYHINDYVMKNDLYETTEEELNIVKEVMKRHDKILARLYVSRK